VEKQYPPTSEIARLAAILSIGRNLPSVGLAETMAREAIELWFKCELEREDQIYRLALEKYSAAEAIIVPQQETYPVSLENFLKIVFPNKRQEARMKIYREFIRNDLRYSGQYLSTGEAIAFEKVPIPSDAEVNAVVERRYKTGYNKLHFSRAYRAILYFDAQRSAETRTNRAKTAAAAKWKRDKKENG
jgi:hypothetical protein